MPLGRGPTDEALELVGQGLRDALHVLAEPPGSPEGQRRPDDAPGWIVRGPTEIDGGGEQRRSSPYSQRGRAGRQLGALTEEVDLDPGRLTDQAVREQTKEVVVGQGLHASGRPRLGRPG